MNAVTANTNVTGVLFFLRAPMSENVFEFDSALLVGVGESLGAMWPGVPHELKSALSPLIQAIKMNLRLQEINQKEKGEMAHEKTIVHDKSVSIAEAPQMCSSLGTDGGTRESMMGAEDDTDTLKCEPHSSNIFLQEEKKGLLLNEVKEEEPQGGEGPTKEKKTTMTLPVLHGMDKLNAEPPLHAQSTDIVEENMVTTLVLPMEGPNDDTATEASFNVTDDASINSALLESKSMEEGERSNAVGASTAPCSNPSNDFHESAADSGMDESLNLSHASTSPSADSICIQQVEAAYTMEQPLHGAKIVSVLLLFNLRLLRSS